MTPLSPQQKPRDGSARVGLNIITIVRYLRLLRKEKHYSKIFRVGPIRHKKTFLKYLKWLVKHGFAINRRDYHVVMFDGQVVRRRRKAGSKPHSFYKTTVKGKKFLELVT